MKTDEEYEVLAKQCAVFFGRMIRAEAAILTIGENLGSTICPLCGFSHIDNQNCTIVEIERERELE